MPRLSLNKSALHKAEHQLRIYQRFLPSLDLKRKHLIAERARAQQALCETGDRLTELDNIITRELPMLADHEVGLEYLVTIAGSEVSEENILGISLPVLKQVHLNRRAYSFLIRPHWVDRVQDLMAEALTLRLRMRVQRERQQRLEKAVRKITQRVNLFDKVLIPRTREHIRKIGIFLADSERAAVVRAKIAKTRHSSRTNGSD
ncbi:MAG: V-type ATP synthase subunit D [Burkholderiales bacterium]|nr:V-type ATP synthase subunit D [Burkholderiales bacterium]